MVENALAFFETDALRFAYPGHWQREVEESEDGCAITLQSAGVTFAIFGIYEESEEPEDLVEQVVESLREEHPGLEVDEVREDQPDVDSHSVEVLFISLDTVSYCWIRGWRAFGHTLLLFMQSIEPESERSHAVFQAICKSVAPASFQNRR